MLTREPRGKGAAQTQLQVGTHFLVIRLLHIAPFCRLLRRCRVLRLALLRRLKQPRQRLSPQ
jgi:hypothetical protein